MGSGVRLRCELLQPYFVDTKFGAATQFLTDPSGGAGDDRDVMIIEREIKIIKKQQRVDKLSAELEALGGPLAEVEKPGRDDDGGGRGGRGGNGGGGKGGQMGGGGKTVGGNDDSAQDERISDAAGPGSWMISMMRSLGCSRNWPKWHLTAIF